MTNFKTTGSLDTTAAEIEPMISLSLRIKADYFASWWVQIKITLDVISRDTLTLIHRKLFWFYTFPF